MARDSERQQVLDRLFEINKQSGKQMLTRSEFVETRHWLLYASQQCATLRDDMAKIDYPWDFVILEIDEVIANLTVLRQYIAHKGSPPVHPNELAGAGAPPSGVIRAAQSAGRVEP